jgi:hypothetical protein
MIDTYHLLPSYARGFCISFLLDRTLSLDRTDLVLGGSDHLNHSFSMGSIPSGSGLVPTQSCIDLVYLEVECLLVCRFRIQT